MHRARLEQSWPADDARALQATTPRDDLLAEASDGSRFVQLHGPFTHYERRLEHRAERVHQTIEYRLDIPWFGWLFGPAVRRALGHRHPSGRNPWWAPPERLDARQVRVLALLAVASFTAIFTNAVFTQTANFAADSFAIDNRGQGLGGVIVRLGVLITLPVAMLADRVGRRRILVILAWVAPLCTALGALAPSFWTLVATQTVARPLGLAMALVISVVAAEEVPRGSRAYAVSLITMAGGFGAGVAVGALRLADIGPDGWRLVYLIALVWLVVAVSLQRALPETRRFTAMRHATPPAAARTPERLPRRRFRAILAVSLVGNVFVAPVSYFQNRYLRDVRGYSGGGIALFTLTTATPAALGLIAGGKLAERSGRRLIILACLPLAALLLVATYLVSGAAMWALALAGGIVAGVAYPATAVYRTELFPTESRGRASGWFTVAALTGGSLGLLGVGWAVDHGWSYGAAMAVVGVAELVAAVIAYFAYPETAHLSLEQLNPGDPVIDDDDAADQPRSPTMP